MGAALLGKAKGYDVFVSDMGNLKDNYKQSLKEAEIEFEEGRHTESKILEADLVVKSPGIPEKAPLIKKLREKGTEIISEIEFASRYTKAKFVAITGSNGKTTTTLLTYHLLKKMGLNTGLAGNVGKSLAKQVIDDKHEYYVLELSSFQLDDMYKFRAHIAILLNITPDHLDRYEYVFQNYVNSKFRIIQNMRASDYFITFTDDPVISKELKERNTKAMLIPVSLREKMETGACFDDDRIKFSFAGKKLEIESSRLPVSGKHNMVNSMCALLVGMALKLDEEKFADAIADFKNASHRLEDAGTVRGVRFVNDSKATNVDSVFYALDSFREKLVWIAGGIDKGNDYSQIESLVKEKVKALICMGKDNSRLHKAFDDKVPVIVDTDDIETAVRKGFEQAAEGDVVLLSPACASFDLFKNYEDRGEKFKTVVKKLQSELKIKN